MERLLDYGDTLVGNYHKARYEFAKQFCTGKRVIDVACGAGNGTRMLGEVAGHVRGIDPFQKLDNNSEILENGFIETLQPSTCDVVVCFETIEHTISIELSIRMLANALKSNGVLLLSFPNGWGETEYHLHDTDAHLIPGIEKYFLITDLYGQNRKSHVEPVRVSRADIPKYENIIVVATKRADAQSELSLNEMFSLVYSECMRRQKEKTGGLGFKLRVLPARIRTKWKRVFGV